MKKSIHGFSLIEVLISLLILSFVLLGWDVLEIFSLRENRNAYFLSVAENQIASMSEQLRALHGKSAIESRIVEWNKQNEILLPTGKGYVCGKYPSYHITLFWGESTELQSCQKTSSRNLRCLSVQIQL